MRKVLISVLLVLLIVLAYFVIFQGISMGSFEILGTSGIIELNDELDSSINEANRKIKSDLQGKTSELYENVETLLQNKESYYNLANVSTESEITEASTEEVYNIEYLWLRVGRHARTEGVNIKMDILAGNAGDSSVKNIAFTVTGQYAGIIEFVSALEDDSELAFRIENFHLLPSGENLQATFDVTGVRIKLETTTSSVGGTADSTNTSTSADNTNTIANMETTPETVDDSTVAPTGTAE